MNMKKLINVIAKLQVGKNHKNDFGKYNYRNAEDILQGLKPLMVEYGVLVTISDEIAMVGDRYYVKATVKCFDTEDGSLLAENSAYAREAVQKKGTDEAQVTGAASSYARKYALGGMFNLAVATDYDEIADEEAKKKAEAKTYKPRFTASQLGEALSKSSIDANDFAQLLYNMPFAKLLPQNIDYCLENYGMALEEYYKRDANRPMGA
jgi:hypothetical protein